MRCSGSVRIVLLAVAVAGCTESPPPAPEVVRLEEHLDRVHLRLPESLAGGKEDGSATWPLEASLDGGGRLFEFDEEHRRSRQGAVRDSTGRLAPGGSLAWLAPVQAGARYQLICTVAGEAAAASFAQEAAEEEVQSGWHVYRVGKLPTADPPDLSRLVAASLLQERVERADLDAADARTAVARYEFVADDSHGGVLLVWNGRGSSLSPVLTTVELRAIPRAHELEQKGFRAEDPGTWLHSFSIHRERRAALPAPVATTWTWEMDLPAGDPVLVSGVGCLVETRTSWMPGAVRATVTLGTASGGETELGRWELDPVRNPLDHGWHDLAVSLARWAGMNVELRFRTESLDGKPAADCLAWSAPRILVPGHRPQAPPSVVLISVDTLRPDRLGVHGYPLPTSPNIDRLASRSVLFERALSTSTYTLPSHATLLSGQHPVHHGINYQPLTVATSATTFLAELLRDRGYETAAFTSGGFVSAKFGFDRGFDRFSEIDAFQNPAGKRLRSQPKKRDPAFNRRYFEHQGPERIIEWLEARRAVPFFLFVHTYAVHDYEPTLEDLAAVDPDGSRAGRRLDLADSVFQADNLEPKDRDPVEVERLSALYDGALRMTDRKLGRVLDFLVELDIDEHLIVVLTSDHGEEFEEHGGLGHGRTVYVESLRIPLLIRYAGAPVGRHIPGTAWLGDVVPTILELTGTSLPSTAIHGRNLLPWIRDAAIPDRPLLVENLFRKRWNAYAYYEGTDKLIHWLSSPGSRLGDAEFELFHLDQDPSEQLPQIKPTQGAALQVKLEAALQELRSHRPAPAGTGSADPDLNADLRALGYLPEEEEE